MTALVPPAPAGTARPAGHPTPSVLRRVALGVTGLLACALPLMWVVNLSRMVLTGELADHRFHQLTGQGLLTAALWLAALLPLLHAGWRGRRPSAATGLLHVSFVGVGLAAAAVAPQGGALVLLAVIAATGALVWLALPRRPRLDGLDLAPAPLAAALLMSAVIAPYAVDQIALQQVATGHHADNPHYFDMAWLLLTCAALGVLGSVVRGARRLLLWAGAPVVLTGIAMVALDEGTGQGLSLVAAGAAVLATGAVLEFAGQRPRR